MMRKSGALVTGLEAARGDVETEGVEAGLGTEPVRHQSV
jgi:hypothetical protein